MATFARLTRVDWDGIRSPVWVNLDRVDTLIPHGEGTQVSFTDSHVNVTEPPEAIAHSAILEHPLAVR